MRVRRIAARREGEKKRVAAYVRVSTRSGNQAESFENQVSYYTTYIQANPDWAFVAVYADHGITGTSAKRRPSFQKMIDTALSGGIDIILVKSISRFSRNVVDCQKCVDELKDAGVEVRFEREGISSFDPGSGFIFSLLSAVAQDESRSISENVKWGYRERYARGEYCIGSNRILGYDTDPLTKKLVPNQDAWIIRLVFRLFLEGISYRKIAEALDASGAKPLRSKGPFQMATIQHIINNETYVGDKLLQKNTSIDFLTKKADPDVKCESRYLTADHEGIIDRDTWNQVLSIQSQRQREVEQGIRKSGKVHHVFYGKAFCAECGAAYTRRTFTVKDKGGNRRYHAWNCRERQRGRKGNGCKGRTIKEAELEAQIAVELGWTYFDAARFENEVDHVDISASWIRILRKAA